MKRRINWKKAVAASVLGLAIALTGSTAANAISIGSGGGSSGGGGGGWDPTGGWQWTYGNSLNDLYNAPGMGAQGGAETYVKNSTGGQALWNDYCTSPDLVRVYWIIGKNDPWAKSFVSGGVAQPWNNPAGGDAIDQAASAYAGKGIYVICVKNDVERITKTENDSRGLATSDSVTSAYAWNTALAPEVIDSSGKDLIGADNLNAQANSKRTSFGAMYDSIATSGPGDYSSKLNELRAAADADTRLEHASLELNENNRAGLAEGGVLSVSEFTRNATINLSQTWSENRSRQYTCDYKAGTNGTQLANPSNCTYGNWSAWVENSGSRSHTITKNMGTQQQTAFWQIVSVHCNPDELAAALAAYGREGVDYAVVSQTHTDSGVTTVLWTSKVAQRPTASGAKLFGVATSPVTDPALLRTGQVGFYDKECSIQCTPSTDTALGASRANSAVDNVSPESGDGLGGAKVGDTISNYFEMFRDNEQRVIDLNVSYPDTRGTAFSYDGHAPISSTFTLWHDASLDPTKAITIAEGQAGYPITGSTPDTSAPGGQVSVYAVPVTSGGGTGTREPLFTGSQAPTVQKNFSKADAGHPVDSYSGPYATQLKGAYGQLAISATWASLADRPVVVNAKWEYQPTTSVTFPSTVGFTAGRSATVLRTAAVSQAIDVRCYATFGPDTATPEYVAKQQTGTGTPNAVDRNILNPDTAFGDSNARRENTNLVIKFVRGVAE